MPNSSSCLCKGIFLDADHVEFLKISVVSVPEKGKANKELFSFLAKKLNVAKSSLEIISGKTDRYKKILIKDSSNKVLEGLQNLYTEVENG